MRCVMVIVNLNGGKEKMFKKVSIVFLCVLATIFLTACSSSSKYKEEAGTYELTSISGDFTMSDFKEYKIVLKADGKVEVNASYATTTQTYNAKGTFDIKDGKINLYTKNGDQTITETYDFDGETIKMNASAGGISFYAVFTKVKDSK